MATEIADAYVAIYTTMPGVKKDIQNALDSGASGASDSGAKAGSLFSSGMAGAIGGAVASVTSRAIDTIGSSIDSAISRVDTMANFPTMMQNLGYSAADAEKEIQRMSAALDGLPTSLDQMTGAVAVFAPLTGGIEEATDLSLALNNALLAGGKSTEMQAEAMNQYSQMLSVGAVDMQAWRTMVAAMPGQMDQLAKSLLGAEAKQTDLYEAMKEGTVSFDDFNQAVIDLNENGSGNFASFEEQARASTGGIATQMQNLKTAIVRSVAGLIERFRPQITAVMGAVKEGVKIAFDAVMGFADWVAANKDWLAPLAISVGVFTAAMWAANAAATVAAAGGILKFVAATKMGTVVMGAFNTVMAMNPIMLVVTAIAALVAGLIWFFTQTELGRQIWEGFINFLTEAWTNITTFLTDTWNNIVMWMTQFSETILTAWNELWTGVGQFFVDTWNNIVMWMTQFSETILTAWHDLWNGVGQFLTDTWNNITTAVQNGINAVGQFITDGLNSISNWWNDTWTSLGNAIHDVFSGMGEFIGGVFENAANLIKAPINAIIDLVNGAIEGLNSIRVDIPDWVPLVGGQSWSLNIPTIPKLADGGIVSARPGGIIANIGEGKYDEAVIPLSPRVLRSLGGAGGQGATVNVYPQPGMSEETIGDMVARRVTRSLRR